ncbi:MAG TPA: homoserine kinase [Candidatus Limnocylindrales bacterium]
MLTVTSAAYTVRVPATSANLGPGFDALGLALGMYDEVTATFAGQGEPTHVEIEGEGAGELLTDESHLVVYAMRETLSEIGRQAAGIRLKCVNRIPQARGLGSSSAAIVAGVTLANALSGASLSRQDELRIAARIEGHPDNVAPCLLGGFTIAWMTAGGARAVSLQPHSFIRPVLLVPTNRGLTEQARAALPSTVPHADAAFNAGRSALLVHALTADPELLFDATEDRLHQDYRAAAWPASAEMVRLLRSVGVAAVISGAGPSVLALTPLPSGFDPGRRWLTHTLAAETGGAALSVSNISGTLGHAD